MRPIYIYIFYNFQNACSYSILQYNIRELDTISTIRFFKADYLFDFHRGMSGGVNNTR